MTLSRLQTTDIIKYPVVTEKGTRLLENNQYSFLVDNKASKTLIKSAIESIFSVNVVSINTSHLPVKKRRVGKFMGRKPNYKKAIITLQAGNVIKLFES